MNNKEKLEKKYLDKEIKIINMNGEPQYEGKQGTVLIVDDIGQLHGTWGGCALIPEVDTFTIVG